MKMCGSKQRPPLSAILMGAMAIFRVAAILAAAANFTTPSPSSLGSSLTFLYQNDLDWTTASEHNSAILLEPQSGFNAQKSCAKLGETLLQVNGTHFTSDMTSLISYLNYEGEFREGQEFWIDSSSVELCRTITNEAKMASSLCARSLPVLCSQSAPFRPAGNQVKEPTFELTIQTKDLTFTGYRDQLSFRFLGIRYANPAERFTYPALYSGSQKSFDATNYGSECVQSGGVGSEDCLFLNIFTPFIPGPSGSDSLKPVVMNIHGGAFTSGTGNDPTFDGGNTASRGDVVVVDINYRLSTLGFLVLDDGVTNGNFGIADQIVALEWVKKYISGFGGDPNSITVIGQSAGAASVRALLSSPKAIPNIAAAIPMSNLAGYNYATTYSQFYNISDAVSTVTIPILEEANCNLSNNSAILACLRAYNAETLVSLINVARFVVVDGTYITTPHLQVDGSGPVAHVPVLMGHMRDDGAAFIGYPTNDNLLDGVSSVIFNPSAESVIDSGLFPEPSGPNATLNVFNVTARITTDVEFRCLDQSTAVAAVKSGTLESVWFYAYNRSYQTPGYDPNAPVCDAPKDEAHPFGDPTQEYFKCHSGELYFAFGNLGQFQLPYRDENDLPFSQFATDTWTSFIRTHNPTPQLGYLEARNYTSTIEQLQKAGQWNALTKSATPTLRLMDFPAKIQEFPEEAQCNFMNLPFTFYENKNATVPT